MHSFLSTLVAAWGATFLIETAVISVALSSRHGWRIRLFSGIWLSACTLPLVWFVLPECLPTAASRGTYVVCAEVFALVVECLLFWWAFIRCREIPWPRSGIVLPSRQRMPPPSSPEHSSGREPHAVRSRLLLGNAKASPPSEATRRSL